MRILNLSQLRIELLGLLRMLSVKPDADAIIARTLIKSGFSWMGGEAKSFRGSITINGTEFKLEISDIDPLFLSLPEIRLMEMPELLGVLPHVFSDKKLCYLDTEGVYFDPYNPEGNMRIVIEAVRQLLTTYADGDLNADFDAEFWAYWKGDYPCHVVTSERESVGGFYKTKTLSGHEQTEYVVARDIDEISRWVNCRKGEYLPSYNEACIVNLDGEAHVSLDPAFPPTSWLNFLTWIHNQHAREESRLLKQLIPILQKDSRATIVLRSPQGVLFGVYVRFVPQISNMLKTIRVDTKRRSKSNRNISTNKLRRILSSPNIVITYIRLYGVDVTEKYMLERNLSSPSLRNKKIALLGCGTVGSFASQLLALAGAGAGKGVFSLFDSDIISSSNMGRHLVGIPYLHERKSDAVKSYLEQHAIAPITVTAHPKLSLHNADFLQKYDLVIDTTGHEAFSTLLAHIFSGWRESDALKTKIPVLLHAWIDGNGHAVRALLDDGTGACYRCLKHTDAGGVQSERFPIFINDVDESAYQVSHTCGESYIPFSAGLSSEAAGIIQQMVLEALQGDPSPRFRHFSSSPNIRKTKQQNVSRSAQCPNSH